MELINKLIEIVPSIAQGFTALSILATVVVRLTPDKKDDSNTSKYTTYLFKVLQWLPTIGVNPQTKKLQEAYEELSQKK